MSLIFYVVQNFVFAVIRNVLGSMSSYILLVEVEKNQSYFCGGEAEKYTMRLRKE
jgi:hypothetical protein